MLNGLDLFSGIGGLALALSPWVRPIAYCENDRYAQGVLLSRMRDGGLPVAPIWDDVRTLDKAIKLLDSAQCDCTVPERDSGHKVGCWMPDVIEFLNWNKPKT